MGRLIDVKRCRVFQDMKDVNLWYCKQKRWNRATPRALRTFSIDQW